MAKQNMAASAWTQEYCSQGYGFCIPVHKNWWFSSFLGGGALITVEVGPDEILASGDGPLKVSLQTGTLASVQATDGSVSVQGDMVYGYREWTDGRHFVISAPASLEAAVRYVTQSIAAR